MCDGMNHGNLRRASAIALCALLLTLAACAAQPPSAQREVRIGNNLNIYDMYDNSRPWGSSYLVGPPMHHDGEESRIDDLRSLPSRDLGDFDGGAVDPSHLPAPGGAAFSTLTDKPLPPLP